MPDLNRILADARERLAAPRLGKSIMHEMDADILVIRRLVEALESLIPTNEERDAVDSILFDLLGDTFSDAVSERLASDLLDRLHAAGFRRSVPEPTAEEIRLATLAAVKKGARSDAESVRNYREAERIIRAAIPHLRSVPERSAEHGPDWSDWGHDHPEEGPSCKCGFNGSPEECAASREPQAEPSDAALRLAERAWMAAYRQEPRERLRAALRAASQAGTEQGENR